MDSIKVLILMGSESDLPTVRKAAEVFARFGVSYEMHVSSAHRSPEKTLALVKGAAGRGVRLLICAAGKAAHLAGVSAAHTTLPVLGLPMETGVAGGLDSLLSTVQMPAGTPVGCFGTGNAGATNAALFAVQVLALGDPQLAAAFEADRKRMADDVEEQDRRINAG
jgi:phosphoribosylaminoimidazole carboxylase PurE protein